MSNFTPDLYWEYNCGADDFDFWVDWGDLTIQKNNLQYIRMTIIVWTEAGGLETKSEVKIPPNAPTSDPYTFSARISKVVCKGQCEAEDYFGKKYYINSLLEIISGGNGSSLKIDEYSYSSSLINPNSKICKTDSLYREFDPSCTDDLPNC